MEYRHEPVLLKEVINFLAPKPGGLYLDCTVGGGGHTWALAARAGTTGRVIGIDRDPTALEAAGKRLEPFSSRVSLVRGDFKDLKGLLEKLGVRAVDGVVFDLGVSSLQLDDPGRGFTYQKDAPLDMRMDPGARTTAADLVNELPVTALTRIIKSYGEERWARRIAEAIVSARRRGRIERTGELVEIIKGAIPAAARRRGPHPARRTFQALRIATNEELTNLDKALEVAVEFCRPGGRVCVISFHSLEDRIVKKTFQKLAADCTCPPGIPVCRCNGKKQVEVLTTKPVTASPAEVRWNPRARSAKLRAVMKL